MKLQSKTRIPLNKQVLGGPRVLVCLPLTATTLSDVESQATQLRQLQPDLVEWRVDGFKAVNDTAQCMHALTRLRAIIRDMPLIFTCRADFEGGLCTLNQTCRADLIGKALQSGQVDLVDVEMANPQAFITKIISQAHAQQAHVILSQHDFEATPSHDHICDQVYQMQKLGADVAKMAVTPRTPADVLTLLSATLECRQNLLEIPMITIAMGPMGAVSRLAGGLFGSDMTFAAGPTVSAPGQIPISDLRKAMGLYYSSED